MGEKPDQIERHIQHQRSELEDNFSELEAKVKSAFDWRSQFSERPGTMLGIAFVGGALAAAILPSTSSITSRVSSRRRSFTDDYSPYTNRETPKSSSDYGTSPGHNAYTAQPRASSPGSETWDNLRNAAIGLATARLSEFIEDLVPGFTEHYKKAASGKPSTPFSSVPPATSHEQNWQKPNGGGTTDYGSHS
jgi:hypothetical protein